MAPPRPAPSRPALSLDGIAAFAGLGPEVRRRVAGLARVEELAADEEVSGFGAVLVLEGAASVCATIVDASVASAAPGTIVSAHGSSAEGVALRVVAGVGGARVAVWEGSIIEQALEPSPSALAEIRDRTDRLQALARATMGPLGELDDEARGRILARMSVRVARPREVIVAAGTEVPGAVLVCAGAVEIDVDDDGARLARSGEVLFAREAREGAGAPTDARASTAGALLLVADRVLTGELAAMPALASLFGA